MVFVPKPKQNSEVILNAPLMGTDQFVKWEYRSLNGTEWSDLVSTPVVDFIIPGSLRVNYVLPKGWKATNAAVVYGDNHMLRYMNVQRSTHPIATIGLTDLFWAYQFPERRLISGHLIQRRIIMIVKIIFLPIPATRDLCATRCYPEKP